MNSISARLAIFLITKFVHFLIYVIKSFLSFFTFVFNFLLFSLLFYLNIILLKLNFTTQLNVNLLLKSCIRAFFLLNLQYKVLGESLVKLHVVDGNQFIVVILDVCTNPVTANKVRSTSRTYHQTGCVTSNVHFI